MVKGLKYENIDHQKQAFSQIEQAISNCQKIRFDYKKNIIIISNQSPAIAQEIIKIVGRGVTFLHGEGAFTHQPREVLLVVAKLTQLAQIKRIVSNIDPTAFMVIHDVTDVMGKGFTNIPALKKKDEKM